MLPHHRFYFLRHGETDWNREGRLQGHADVPLNALGETQAERARRGVAALGAKSIAVSTLARARRTAEIVNRGLDLPMTAFDDLREVDVGPFQGVSDADWLRRWRGGEAMPGVESFPAFSARIGRGLALALGLDHPVLIVSHGGVFRAIARLIGHDHAPDLPNAIPVRIEPPAEAGGVWRIALV